MTIESVNNEKVKTWKKIRTKKYIDELGIFIVEGTHLVEEALKAGKAVEIILLEGTSYDASVPKHYVTEKVMNTISLMKSIPSVMAVVKKEEENNEFGKKIIFLDNVQDPGNVGTIIRSAVAFNFDTVILTNETASYYNDKVLRASEGMIFKINIITGERLELLKKLKEKNYKIYGTKMKGNITLEEVESKDVVFILGNEGSGISDESVLFSDGLISIPMNKDCESLNVSAVGAIIMYMKR